MFNEIERSKLATPPPAVHTDVHLTTPAYIPITTATATTIATTITTPTDNADEDNHPVRTSSVEPLTPPSTRAPHQRIMSMELPVFLVFLAFIMSDTVMQNQQLYQTCLAVFNYNASDCEPLRGIIPKTKEAEIIEKAIQPYVSKINMVSSMLYNVWPGVVVLFVGPWSDKFGRRPILLLTFAANFFGLVLTTTLVTFSERLSLNPWLYLLGGLPLTLTGGACCMITITFCCISDVSDMESKAKRMYCVDMAMGLGVVFGNVVSSYLLLLTNISIVCLTSAVLSFLAFVYIVAFVGESLDVEETSLSEKAKHFFDVGLIRDMVKTCAMRRPNYGRALLICIFTVLIVMNFAGTGEIGIFYFFLRTKFNVTLQQFTYFNAFGITIKMVGCLVAFSLFRSLFKMPFTIIAMMGVLGCFIESLSRAFAQHFWQMYMASAFGLMAGITGPMLQSILSLMIPSNEIGKVYSLSSCLHTLTPLLSAPLYTFVYNHTIHSNPGLFNFISAGIYVVCFCVMIVTRIFEHRASKELSRSEAERGETNKSQVDTTTAHSA